MAGLKLTLNEGSMFVHARLDLLHAIELEAHKLKTTLYMARELYVITSMADYAPHWEARLTIGCVVMCSGVNTRARGRDHTSVVILLATLAGYVSRT